MNSLPVLLRMNGNHSTKDQIVSILSQEFPLSAKQIFNYVSKNSGNVSYQAVHKALQELVSGCVVEKRGKEFLLSSRWIDYLNNYSNQLGYRYNNNLSKTLDNHNFVFKTVYDCDMFLIETFVKIAQSFPKNERPLIIMQCRHAWAPLFLSKLEYKKLVETLKRTKCYALIKGNSSIDKWCVDFWHKNEVSAKSNVDVASNSDFYVAGDYVISVFFPMGIRQKMDKAYSETESQAGLDVNHLFHSIFETETEIVVTINRNQQIADQVKEQTLSFFKQA